MQKTISFILTLWLLGLPVSTPAAEIDMTRWLPAPACHPDWRMDGPPTLFDKDTLFDHINGESELYFPYGFELLAFAKYVNRADPKAAFDADIYKMGSRLDAFGMYANYRRKDDAAVRVGTEGSASSSQLLFYQDRYLVRLQSSGTANPGPEIFLACARAISGKLPPDTGRPKELEPFDLAEIDGKSIRYIAQSLLGYDFFPKGLIADASWNDQSFQVFQVFESSPEAARKAIDRYGDYVKASGETASIAEQRQPVRLTARDPMYGNTVIEQQGPFVYGAIRIRDVSSVQPVIDKLRKRMAGMGSIQK